MPCNGNKEYGDLYITFEIDFPNILGEEHKKYISKLIPNKNTVIEPSENSIKVKMEPFDKDLLNTDDLEDSEINLEEHDNDREDFDPGNCATQ